MNERLLRAYFAEGRPVGHDEDLAISGVPCFVIDLRYGVWGAQDPELFARALAQSADASQVQT